MTICTIVVVVTCESSRQSVLETTTRAASLVSAPMQGNSQRSLPRLHDQSRHGLMTESRQK